MIRAAICCLSLALAVAVSPAEARRRAIDVDAEGNTIDIPLTGYCDLNGDECGPDDALRLPYTVQLGSSPASNKVFVHGNGLLTFGQSIDFGVNADYDFLEDSIAGKIVFGGIAPSLNEYGVNVISAGQNVLPASWTSASFPYNFGDAEAFFQSGKISVTPEGVILAEWFVCVDSFRCPDDIHSLSLTPSAGGFQALFTGTTPTGPQYSGPRAEDQGYIIDGVFTSATYDQEFFIPATFGAVPEPESWMLLIAGFGLVGSAARRQTRRLQTAG